MLRNDEDLSVDLVEQLWVVAIEALRGCRMILAGEDAASIAATPTLTCNHVTIARMHVTLVDWHAAWRELLLLLSIWLTHTVYSIVLHVHLGTTTMAKLQHHL